ncbi:NAD(P)-dependent oxidoreductase [Pseudomonas sp. PWP3-1b2]|uniref:NAD(P)-dependent oxidoreductase n=1 Tax=Pseudomonas sp. PWP3-1b2 TaxID=2804656 RepID=UPI003CF99935
MKIALIGSTGFVGAAVLAELLSRDHEVLALSRKPVDASADGVKVVTAQVDVLNESALTKALTGQDAVVSAFNPGWSDPDLYQSFMRGSAAIVQAVSNSGVKRLLVVGGAGSLYVSPGVQLVDTPDFLDHVPPAVIPGAQAARDALTQLRTNTALEWTFLSPAAFLTPGERSGQYRVGGEQLLMDGDKPAGISVQDLAVAIVDELERPQHVRARFTVASGA